MSAATVDVAHHREPIVDDPRHPGRYLAACSCGDYEDDLESKRAGRRWQARHFDRVGDHSAELATPVGRGRLASIARRRALESLGRRHAAELAGLESSERVLLGLNPLPAYLAQDRTR